MSEILREIVKKVGMYETRCSMCQCLMADYRPMPELPVCCFCQRALDKALASMPSSGKVQ